GRHLGATATRLSSISEPVNGRNHARASLLRRQLPMVSACRGTVKPTFGQVFALSLVGFIALLALLFYLVSAGSRQTIAESSERIREQASSAIGERIANFL